MMKKPISRTLLALAFVAIFAKAEDLQLPNVFSDHMVLQRETPVNVWGKAVPNTLITVEFKDQIKITTSDFEGLWMLQLDPMPACKKGEVMTVSSPSNESVFADVVVGDVWLCSGQSNMEWPLEHTTNGDIEIASPEDPLIRLYQVERIVSPEPRFTAASTWETCSAASVRRFSAVGYYFGENLNQVLDIPIGLIDSSWGGTPLVAWVEESALLKYGHTAEEIERWNRMLENYEAAYTTWKRKVEDYEKTNGTKVIYEDAGITESEKDLFEPGFDDTDWKQTDLPDMIENHIGEVDGVVWYRRKVALPESFQNRPLSLHLGPIDDQDVTFVNGVEVGSHTGINGNSHMISRVYEIGDSVNTEPSMTIAVRIFDKVGGGGFSGSDQSMALIRSDEESIPLAGPWKYFDGGSLPSAVGPWSIPGLGEPQGPNSPNRPGILAASMLTPVCPYSLKGAIWYQGESDAGWDPDQYEQRLEILLKNWESRWNQATLPFGIVQLANFTEPTSEPTDGGWQRIRDSQLRFSQAHENVGLAVTIDLGETDDIHPRNKKDVGGRLARWALADIYGKLSVGSGPTLKESTSSGNAMLLSFGNIGNGLKAMNGTPLNGFTIAGQDRVFHLAEAKIVSRNSIEVFSPEVAKPVAVRYAWSNNPEEANLVSEQRLPASPFRTDTWEAEPKSPGDLNP